MNADTMRLRVLHTVKKYLEPTENWLYHLICHTPDVDVLIGSRHFLATNFYRPDHTYIQFPFRRVKPRYPGRLENILWRVVERALRYYPQYLARQAKDADIMHSHFGFVGWDYLKVAGRLGIPHVVSFYGYDYVSLPKRDERWSGRYEEMFREASCFLCEGPAAAALLRKIGCPDGKIRTLPLGVVYHPGRRQKRKKEKGALDLIQLATFREKKGHRYTIEAFLAAARDCPNATLTLAGPDPKGLRAELEREVAGTGASERIRFLDGIPYEQLDAHLRDYHVFIHPSCHAESGDCEGGAPIVLLDAQATGMPVIATRHCDIPETVQPGRTGMLVEERDTSALGSAIRQFYDMDQADYNRFADAAETWIRDNRDMRHSGRLLREIYLGLLR